MWNVLWYCEILCYMFLRVELALVFWSFVLYFSAYGTRSGIVEFHFIFSVCGKRSSIVEFCVISFCVPVERALVLWNFVLYISACEMCLGIVEFCVIYFCMWNTLWYCCSENMVIRIRPV